ncbi:MAG: HEPN domain-containing protein [Candidatus Pacebacteria bacterium]|nr:HEPN domain-containing protein [Candidatus Paceibacterota bacterium]
MKRNINEELVGAWIYKGKDDLLFAKASFKETEFYSQICCLCQQAVEKYIKATILASKGKLSKKDKIHNLNILANKAKSFLDLSQFEKELRMLTQSYIPARYPAESHIKVFSKNEARGCIEIAEKITEFIENKLKKAD